VSGTLFGLGIGPGDPDLVTIKARDVLARVPVVAYPAPEGGTSLVRAIAAPHVPEGRVEIIISTPMSADRFPADEVYDRYAAEIAGHLEAGRDVAILCEGDPFLYGSFMYLFERLAGDHRAEVVPGVSSLNAVAAAAGAPLVSRNEMLSVLPATLPEDELEARLAISDAVAVMKVGRNLAKVRRVLRRLGTEDAARYVERATMAEQRVMPLDAVSGDTAPYFSMILVRRPGGMRAIAADDSVPEGAAIIALGAGGLALARRLQRALPESTIYGLSGRADGPDVTFSSATDHIRALFAAGTPIVGVCAAGILIRALAPALVDKTVEPPVVAVAEDGSAVVPLLGGHHGANRLARALARALGARAAITTAGDLRLGIALDDPPPGWHVASSSAAKDVAAAMLSGEPVALRVEAGNVDWLRGSGAPFADDGDRSVLVTDRANAGDESTLVLHPPVLAVGVGCERGADADELIGLVRQTLAEAGLAKGAVACVASIDLKSDEAAVHAVADALGVPVRFFDAPILEAEAPRLANPSEAVFREVGCHGVAEGAALAAVGAEGTLIVEKAKSTRATCAVGRATRAIDPSAVGAAQGRLRVVGIGPGDAGSRTPDATRAIAEATDVVGYGLYLDLVGDAIAGKKRHDSALSEEEARVRAALDLAAAGRTVALVCSGDAGIYALASLVFELLDREDRGDWNRVAITVVPGVSALQSAAAGAGAAIGHDFCAVSLSDLLTPWPEIERRLHAAAEGDFVVALYNPVSQRRRTQLAAARDILLTHRPPETPVLLARNIGRAGETFEVIRLEDLTPEHADMLTLVLVGNSQSRVIARGVNRWLYTPRGYAAKMPEAPARATGS